MLSKLLRSSILAVTIGGALEWYEFSLYIYLSPVIAQHYFSSYPPSTGLILTALIFAIGFISRPIGGLFFGHIGDRYGRKIAMLVSIIMITIPTLGMSLLPESSNMLIMPCLLLFLRLLQGILTGGELPGMVCYLTEGVPPNKERFISSLAFVGPQLGMLVSILECTFLENALTPENFISWGWRISFLVGGLIGLMGCFLRSRLKETHNFILLKQHSRVNRRPVLTSLFYHKKNLLIAVLLVAAPLGTDFLIFGYSNIYLQKALGCTTEASLLIIALLLLFTTLMQPLFGKLGDHFPNKPLLIIATIGLILISYPLYYCISHQMPISIALAVMTAIFISCYYALVPFALSRLFPTSVRYSCIGLSYNTGACLFGGTAPLFAMLLVKGTSDMASPSLIIIASSALSLITLMYLKEARTAE
ncbi:MAG: MFS transporter [Verrucomicrobia bacterium]|nr:MFS transporter [Verrucomicrobiota bacterium]